jgi:4-hydroxybenzoate polyprenyltransferase
MRPRQWYKNIVVFVPLLFSGNLGSAALWAPALGCFAAFCLLSSAVYAANDVLDAERDRLHPRKRNRPVAAGQVSATAASLLALALVAASMAIFVLLGPTTLLIAVVYLLLQIAYNLALKQLILWDALSVAAGFVLRALAGTTAIAVPFTEWLIVCTFLFALYLAMAKRRHELVLAQDHPESLAHRPILGDYTVEFVEQVMQASATLLLAAYSLYTFFGTDQWMMFTIPFAFYGVFRFSYLVHRRDLGDEAEMVLRDRATLVNAALWLLVILAVQRGLPQRLVDLVGQLG